MKRRQKTRAPEYKIVLFTLRAIIKRAPISNIHTEAWIGDQYWGVLNIKAIHTMISLPVKRHTGNLL